MKEDLVSGRNTTRHVTKLYRCSVLPRNGSHFSYQCRLETKGPYVDKKKILKTKVFSSRSKIPFLVLPEKFSSSFSSTLFSPQDYLKIEEYCTPHFASFAGPGT